MKIIRKTILCLALVGTILIGGNREALAAGSYDEFKHIQTSQFFEQSENDYYVYFYYEDCKDCNYVKEEIREFAQDNSNIYFIDYEKEENKVNAYDWNEIREKYNKQVGILDENGNIAFFPGESYEKYENVYNKYGKKMTFAFKVIGNEVFTDVQTPEIDYVNIKMADDLIIAGVPTLLYVRNGAIEEFYYDSYEILDFLEQ